MSKAPLLPDYIQQPGPDGAPYMAVPTQLVNLDFELPAGASLHASLAQALKARGLWGGYFRIADMAMSQVSYVIPALPCDEAHVAWYSTVHTPKMPGQIVDAGILCGFHNDAAFFHCHGRLSDAAGTPAMGHLLPEACVLLQPARVIGHGFCDARFTRNFDPQTGFELFSPKAVTPASSDAEAQLIKIAPNTQISAALIECCRNAGWERAFVQGIGSIIGAHFDDGRVFDSFATEFLLTKGEIDLTGSKPDIALDIELVGLDGTFQSGRLMRQKNPVLITAEIVMIKGFCPAS
jgi:predicted DNA-binding protein with PD1-like motif